MKTASKKVEIEDKDTLEEDDPASFLNGDEAEGGEGDGEFEWVE